MDFLKIKGSIILTVKKHTNETKQLQELEMHIDDDMYDQQKFRFFIHTIVGYFLGSPNDVETHLHATDGCIYYAVETPEQIDRLILESQ